jgi:lipoyl(octanoyl) transferase
MAGKIAAIGIKVSRWITMHGFAFNVNTDLSLFDGIIPCGIKDKNVTSLQNELGITIDINEVKSIILKNFTEVFEYSPAAKMEPDEILISEIIDQ